MTSQITKKIGEQMALYRKIKNKSRKQIGNEIGVSYQQIKNYESGKHRVSACTLFRISEILETPIEKFFEK